MHCGFTNAFLRPSPIYNMAHCIVLKESEEETTEDVKFVRVYRLARETCPFTLARADLLTFGTTRNARGKRLIDVRLDVRNIRGDLSRQECKWVG